MYNKKFRAQEIEGMLKAGAINVKVLSQEALVDKATSTLAIITKKMEQMKQSIIEYDKQLRSKKHSSIIIVVTLVKKCVQDELTHLVEIIENSLCPLKGKHNSTKARILMEDVSSGKLFNGEAAEAVIEDQGIY